MLLLFHWLRICNCLIGLILLIWPTEMLLNWLEEFINNYRPSMCSTEIQENKKINSRTTKCSKAKLVALWCIFYHYPRITWSSHRRCSVKIDVLKNFANLYSKLFFFFGLDLQWNWIVQASIKYFLILHLSSIYLICSN